MRTTSVCVAVSSYPSCTDGCFLTKIAINTRISLVGQVRRMRASSAGAISGTGSVAASHAASTGGAIVVRTGGSAMGTVSASGLAAVTKTAAEVYQTSLAHVQQK